MLALIQSRSLELTNKLLEILNSVKVVSSFAVLNLNTIVQEKKRQKNARFMGDVLKTNDIKYSTELNSPGVSFT